MLMDSTQYTVNGSSHSEFTKVQLICVENDSF